LQEFRRGKTENRKQETEYRESALNGAKLRRTAPRHKASVKACPEQATARRMGGRARLRPNRGFPADPRTTRDPPQTNRCKMQRPSGAPSPNTNPSMNRSFRSSQRVICVGSSVFPRLAGKPRFGRSLSLPPIRRAVACSGQAKTENRKQKTEYRESALAPPIPHTSCEKHLCFPQDIVYLPKNLP
jgi:hypothetical protein